MARQSSISEKKHKYTLVELEAFIDKYNSLLSNIRDVNKVLDDNDSGVNYDLIKCYYTYMVYSGAIEELNHQIILYKFGNDALEYFNYYGNSRGDFVDESKIRQLIDENWIDAKNIQLIENYLYTTYKSRNVVEEVKNTLSNFSYDKFVDYYNTCREKRNKMAHRIKPNDMEFTNEICIKFEIIVFLLIQYLKDNYIK